VIVNLEQAYQVWMETLRKLNDMPYNMRIKEVPGRDYLYEVTDRLGTMKSKGPLDRGKQATRFGRPCRITPSMLPFIMSFPTR